MQKLLWLGATAAAAALGYLTLRSDPPSPSLGAAQAFIEVNPHFEPTVDAGTYAARGPGFALELSALGAQVKLARGESRDSIRLDLEGASAREARPEQALPGVSNYFLGSDPKAWRTSVPHFARVRYENVYPGVDLVYYGARDALEYDFVVAPGADPARIRMSYAGARKLHIDDEGNLRIAVPGGELLHRRPVSYQTIGRERKSVDSAFRLERGVVSFELGDYDPRLPLTIDPVLSYATYLGGTSSNERIDSLQADAAGALYIAGHTNSSNFPVSGGVVQGTAGGSFDAFIAKLNPAGTAFEYVTYLGGSDIEESHALRVDAAGNAYLAGFTWSSNFPVTAGAPQGTLGGARDAFVVKLGATGGTLLYGTYLGGSESEPSSARLGGFEVDASGNAYVLGDTASTNFPTTAGAPQTARGNPNGAQFDEDLFLTRINAAGTAFAFSTYHGGGAIDATTDDDLDPRLLAIDASGNAWIAGTSESADLPTTPGAFDTTFNGPAGGTPGGGDALVAKFDTNAGTRVYSSYLGGTGDELAMAIAVDAAGNAYLATRSQSNNFPLTAGAPDAVYGGGGDVTLTKFNAAGSATTYSTYLGGGLNDSPEQIRLHTDGSLYVAGNTRSPDFPATAGAADTTFNTGFDGFVARLDPAGTAFQYVTYIGTADENALFHLEVDAAGSAYVVLEDLEGDMTLTTGGRAHAGELDDLFVKINPAGSAFLDVSYLGGVETEYASAFTIDAAENVYFGGTTSSANYPTTAGAPQPARAGAADDTYLAKFATTPAGPAVVPGTVALSAATYSVNENAGTASVTVTRTSGSSGAISVSCTAATAGANTATAGSDYTAASTTLNWADGDAASKTCSVTIANDAADEPDETFTVSLGSVTGGASLGAPATAVVTIVDDDAAPVPQPGTVQFNPATYSANENGGSVTLTLTRTLGADGAISVSVASGGGSATAGTDYTALAQTVNWADGDSAAKTLSLTMLDDTTDEPNETVTVTLSNATGGAVLGNASATVTLVDDDVTPAPPPPPAPVTQTTTVSAKYGKGSLDAWWLATLGALLCLVMARRRRVALAGAAALAVAAPASADPGWYAGVRAGVAQTTQDEDDLQRGLAALGHTATVSLDDRHTAFTLFGGHRWENGLALEAGFSNLGEFEADIEATTNNPAALAANTLALLGDGGRAFSASVAWRVRLGDRLELTPRVGGYYWESTREVGGAAGLLRDRDHGYDLTAGLLLSLKFQRQWSVGVGVESWAARGNNDVRTWVLEVRKEFGAH
jgi:hypothetical protein